MWGTQEAINALCHSYCPKFFGPCDSFLQMDYVSLMEIKIRQIKNLQSYVACWQFLNITCPQHVLTNGIAKFSISHQITEVNVIIMVEISFPSSLT
jgi:hypothetical protein